MDVESNKAIGECLRRERAKRDLRQTDVARALGRPQSFVSKLETGERNLAVSEVFSYAKALGMSAQELFRDVAGALTWGIYPLPDLDQEDVEKDKGSSS